MKRFIVKSLLIETPYNVKKISIQTLIRKGIPSIKILGIPNQKSIEISSKIQSVFISNQIQLPFENIQINISPSGIKHYYNYLDFSIFASLLFALNEDLKNIPPEFIENSIFLGEINLFGEVEYSESFIPHIILSYNNGFRNIFLPKQSLEDTLVLENLNYYFIKNIKDLINKNFKPEKGKKNIIQIYTPKKELEIPEKLLKLLPIAISGKHPVLILENHKLNKSFLLEQMEFLFPELDRNEILQILLFHSKHKEMKRPYTKLNPSITKKEILGDSNCSGLLLENQYGILFLEDLQNFDRNVLLLFKEILEKKEIKIRYKNGEEILIENNFWFFFSAQTCACGNYLSKEKECICNQRKILDYIKKFIILLKYQIDLFFYINHNKIVILREKEIQILKDQIKRSIEIQKKRFENENFKFNSLITLDKIEEYCLFDSKQTKEYFEEILSNSFYEKKIQLKISRTIADFKEHILITKEDLIEANEYRKILSLYEPINLPISKLKE